MLADKGDTCVAGALMYRSDDRLYGRHWGCSEYINSLHFEAWLATNNFLTAITNFTQHEQQAVLEYIEDLNLHLLYK